MFNVVCYGVSAFAVPGVKDYFSRNKRITKSIFGFATMPSLDKARFRFFDFFVRMWRLKERWCVIFPVPVTLKRFLALEFVFTLGIVLNAINETLEATSTGKYLWGLFRKCPVLKRSAKVINIEDRNDKVLKMFAMAGQGGCTCLNISSCNFFKTPC